MSFSNFYNTSKVDNHGSGRGTEVRIGVFLICFNGQKYL